MPDSIGVILKDYIEWLGTDVTVLCGECGKEFIAPENSNGAKCGVCHDCWYKPTSDAGRDAC